MTTIVTPYLLRTPQPSLLVNEDMRINQREFSTVALSAGGIAFPADKFLVYSDSVGITVSRDSDSPPISMLGYKSVACAKIESTSAGALGELSTAFNIEGSDGLALVDNKIITFSFAAKFNYAGQFSVGIRNSNNTASYVKPFSIISGGDWNMYSMTLSVDYDTAGGTWNFGRAALMGFVLGLGNTFATTSTYETWLTGNTPYAVGNTSLKGASGRIAKFCGLKAELGAQRTPLIQIPITEAQDRCQRYYQRNPILFGAALNATTQYFTWPFKTEMVANPTVNLLSTTPNSEHPPFSVSKVGAGSGITSHVGTGGCDMSITGFTGLTTNSPSMLYNNNVEAVCF